MQPFFSIIIPVYNLENFVGRCIESVICQEFNSWEAIVINDGSKDKSLEVVKSLTKGDRRFRVIDKRNEGLSAARNDGLIASNGEYIIFLDGDDWLQGNALLEIVTQIQKNTVDVLIHTMNYYYSEQKNSPKRTSISEGLYTGRAFLDEVLTKKEYNFCVAPAKVYRRDFIAKYHITFIKGILHEDGPFFFEICHKAQNILFLAKPLYFYRQDREGQITGTMTSKNVEGVLTGIANTYRLFGYKDKVLNAVTLDSYTFLWGPFKKREDEKNTYKILRSWKRKKEFLRLILFTSANISTKVRGILLLIDPLALKYGIKLWFKK